MTANFLWQAATPPGADPYTTELNESVQKIIHQDPKRAPDETYYQKDLLLLIFKPNEVPGLHEDTKARVAAHNLYLNLQYKAMSKVSADFHLPPPTYEEAVSQDESKSEPQRQASPPPLLSNEQKCDSPPPVYASAYDQACDEYKRNRRYCDHRGRVWCDREREGFTGSNYYDDHSIRNLIIAKTVCSAIELSMYGALFIPNLVQGAAFVGTVADGAARGGMHCGKNFYIIGAIIAAGLACGLLVFAASELIKAYQEDKDSHTCQRKLTIIAPTLIASAAAGYCAAAFVGVLTGLTVSTGGIALAVAVAISLTAVLSVLTFKLLTNLASTHRYQLKNSEEERLEARGVNPLDIQGRINDKRITINNLSSCGFTFFWTDANKAIRKNRQEIYNLRTHGYDEAPPRYGQG